MYPRRQDSFINTVVGTSTPTNKFKAIHLQMLQNTCKKKFLENLIAYFPLMGHRPNRKRRIQQLFYYCGDMHWLLGRKSQLSTTNKLLLYKTILKPIWTYGIQLWGTASIEILGRFQSKVLRMIVGAPWYVSNSLIRRDLSCTTVKE
jgi:hypothetical protein